jgi:hypothetical protein
MKKILLLVLVLFMISFVSAVPCDEGRMSGNCECGSLTYTDGYCCNTGVDPIWFDPYYERWFETTGCPTSYVYVDQNDNACNDNGPGTESQPYCSLHRATWGGPRNTGSDPEQPALAAQAGDVVLVKSGEYYGSFSYYHDPAFRPANSGTPTYPIIFRSYPGHQTNLTADGAVIGGKDGTNNVVWDGFILYNVVPNLDFAPAVAIRSGSHDMVVMNNEIIGETAPTCDRCNYAGISFNGQDGTVYNLVIRNNRIHGFIWQDPNVAGILMYQWNDSIFENNEIYDCVSMGIFAKGNFATGNIYRYNLIHDVRIGIDFYHEAYPTDWNLIYQNIIYNCGYVGIAFDPRADNAGLHNADFYNNLLYNCSDSAFLVGDPGTGLDFFNNIISDTPTPIFIANKPGIEVTSDYNGFNSYSNFVYYGTNVGRLSGWQTASGNDINSLEVDPLFFDVANRDFHLQPGSPMINAGMDVWDYDNDDDTSERINMGPYITGDEVIGFIDYVVHEPLQSCNSLGGQVCDVGEVCDGNSQPSLDGDCCLGNCVVIPTCADQGGDICTLSESCNGTFIEASDSDRCCSGNCYVPSSNNCADQGGVVCDPPNVCSGSIVVADDTDYCCIQGNCDPPSVPVVVSVDSTYPGYSIDLINDDSTSSGSWASGDSATDPHWVAFNFSSPQDVGNVTVYWAWNGYWMTPQHLDVQIWDGNDYVTVGSFDRVVDEPSTVLSFTPVTTTSFRIWQPADMSNPQYSRVLWLTEIDYGTNSCFSTSFLLSAVSDWYNGNLDISSLVNTIKEWKVNSC